MFSLGLKRIEFFVIDPNVFITASNVIITIIINIIISILNDICVHVSIWSPSNLIDFILHEWAEFLKLCPRSWGLIIFSWLKLAVDDRNFAWTLSGIDSIRFYGIAFLVQDAFLVNVV